MERYAQARNITIKAYHADNGIFKAKEWVQACYDARQQLTFAAVGAHHANGEAERHIRELQELAQTQLIHANRRWPNAITSNLWPYALRHANDCMNNTPNLQNASKLTPQQLFTATTVMINEKHWKPFGCPVFVLDKQLQSGHPYQKWKQRARVGIYLGQSPIHNRNVALVLHRNTGHVSPQFHVKFDPSFHTVQQDKLDCTWQQATYFVQPPPKKQLTKQTKQPKSSPDTQQVQTSHREADKSLQHPSMNRERIDPRQQEKPTEPTITTTKQPQVQRTKIQQQDHGAHITQSPRQQEKPTEPTITTAKQPQVQRTKIQQQDQGAHITQSPHGGPSLHRSQQVRSTPQRLIELMYAEMEQHEISGELLSFSTLFPRDATMDMPSNPLMAFKATNSDPDTMYHHQAMHQPDRAQFIGAMQKEMDSQLQDGNFEIVHRSKIPNGTKVFPAVWQMHRKRDIATQQIKKWKAQLNFDGSSMKKGVHYDYSYAPVASWGSIRLALAIATAHNWVSTQVDYVLAFTQAPVERPVYMDIPRGFKMIDGLSTKDYTLLLHGNVYGHKQAVHVWNKYLTKCLVTKAGFVQSKVDDCFFYKGNVIYVLYTDDSILFAPTQKEVDNCIADIEAAGLNITVESDVKDFLGVNIERHPNGTVKFSQPHLINKILKALQIDTKTTPKDTPAASSRILSRGTKSAPFDQSFHYRSVIGMLNYLDAGSRSDIAYATHQCARFAADPKKEHGKAVRWIGWYLNGTKEQGMIFMPDSSLGLEV